MVRGSMVMKTMSTGLRSTRIVRSTVFRTRSARTTVHIKALESFLRTTRSVFTPIVVFSPRSRLMTALPPQVLTSDHAGFVRSRVDVVLSPEEFDRICASLDTLKARSDIASFDRHVKQLNERFESATRCPRCNGDLVRRQSRT